MSNGCKHNEYTEGQRLGTKTSQVLQVIKDAVVSPTYAEIGIKVGLNKSGVAYHVGVLKDAGLVNNKPSSARTTK